MPKLELTKDEIKYTRRIEGVRTISIPASDFVGEEGRKNKKAIQFLFLKHYFTDEVDPSEFLDSFGPSNVGAINSIIASMKKSSRFDLVYSYKPEGIGPGEVLLYLITNNTTLSGFKTGDLKDRSNVSYEVKVGTPVGTSAIEDIRLANAKGLNSVYNKLIALQTKLKIANNKESIEKSIMGQLRTKGGTDFTDIEKEFKQRVVEYFSGKNAVLMYGDKDKKSNFGLIADIKTIKADDVTLHRYTNKEFKAQILI